MVSRHRVVMEEMGRWGDGNDFFVILDVDLLTVKIVTFLVLYKRLFWQALIEKSRGERKGGGGQ